MILINGRRLDVLNKGLKTLKKHIALRKAQLDTDLKA